MSQQAVVDDFLDFPQREAKVLRRANEVQAKELRGGEQLVAALGMRGRLQQTAPQVVAHHMHRDIALPCQLADRHQRQRHFFLGRHRLAPGEVLIRLDLCLAHRSTGLAVGEASNARIGRRRTDVRGHSCMNRRSLPALNGPITTSPWVVRRRGAASWPVAAA